MKITGRYKEILPMIFFLIWDGIWIALEVSNYRAIKVLKSFNPQEISGFTVQQRNFEKQTSPKVFQASEPIVLSFFQALNDSRSYSPNHDTVRPGESWEIQFNTGITSVSIQCYIPANRDEHIVVGELEELPMNSMGLNRGNFQSYALFQWYQTYHTSWSSQ